VHTEQPSKKSNAEKLAQSSFVLAMSSIFCGITALPAVFQSIRALVRVKKECVPRRVAFKAAFSLVFSICTFLGFAVVIIAPIRAAQAMADGINCVNNMKQLGLALRIYEGDHDIFPSIDNWCDSIQSTNVEAKVFHCPRMPTKQRCSYAMNARLRNVKQLSQIPGDTVLLFESDAGWNALGGPEIAAGRHGSWIHIVFADGSVQALKFQEIDKLRWNPATNSP
jgi:prepilin-type processing-associated H-X9-DG protein